MNIIALTDIQKKYLVSMCLLLIIQVISFIGIVYYVQKYMPERKCILFTCNYTMDIISILFLQILCIMFIFMFKDMNSLYHTFIRYTAFFGIGILFSYIIAISMNISNNEEINNNFFTSLGIVGLIFIGTILLLPLFLPYANYFIKNIIYLYIFFFILVLLSILFTRYYFVIIFGLILFLIFLMSDLVILIDNCKYKNTIECDPPTGATTLYADLINIFTRIFNLLDKS